MTFARQDTWKPNAPGHMHRWDVGPVIGTATFSCLLVAMGDRIGMMKFGSLPDIYLPADSVDVVARRGDAVRAGETIIPRMKGAPR